MKLRKILIICLTAMLLACFCISAEAAELKLNQSGEQVEQLQLKLIALGYLDNSCKTGYYGQATKNAVMSFQRDNGLQADGIAGTKTNQAIESRLTGVDNTKVYGPGDTSDEVSSLQLLLVQKGYLSSYSVSGVYGQVTKNAVMRFQSDNKLVCDGIAGRKTLAKLLGIELEDNSIKTNYTKPDKKKLDVLFATLNDKQKDEIYLLSQLITAEAGGEPYEGQVAVGSVVLNRMEASGKSMKDIIFAKNAFSVVKDGKINKIPTEQCRYAAIQSYFGAKPVSSAQYFNMKNIESWASKNKELYRIIGNHAFYI